MLTGNKGEWSEIYTLLKLLADGKLYAGDADLNKLVEMYFPIIKIIREEKSAQWEYIVNGNIRVVNAQTGKLELEIPVEEFENQAVYLFKEILRANTSTFSVPDTESFISLIGCSSLKAASKDKRDITMVVHDLNTGANPQLGFSIKSRLGSPSTLFNPGERTNFIYRIIGNSIDNDVVCRINSINSSSRAKDRIRELLAQGFQLEYCGTEGDNLHNNLYLIDTSLPRIVAEMLVYYYKGTSQDKYLQTLVGMLEVENPCNFPGTGHPFYRYKVKNFLTDAALGMTAAKVWKGIYDATGGYIVVKEDGDILCYHIYKRDEFQEYLLKNSYFDTASMSRYGFGSIYKANGEHFIKLNLQIRFK